MFEKKLPHLSKGSEPVAKKLIKGATVTEKEARTVSVLSFLKAYNPILKKCSVSRLPVPDEKPPVPSAKVHASF